jgi:hypothetical protein
MKHLIVSDVCSAVENMTLREPAALGRIQNRRLVLLSWLIVRFIFKTYDISSSLFSLLSTFSHIYFSE